MSAPQIVRCRYLTGGGTRGLNQCTGEAAQALGEILLCTRHLAAALELLRRVQK